MKKIFFLPVLAFLWEACFLPLPVLAQELQAPLPSLGVVEQTKPPLTSPLTVALVYYKLTARAPDFDSWVKQQDAYRNASSFDQPAVMANMVQKLKDAYNLLLLTDPLIVETQALLSPYDAKNQGFFIQNFKPSTFFPATYAGQSYAIVPQDIMDKQWLKVDDPEVVAAIEKAAAGNGRLLTLILFLIPRYADAKSPAFIDGENYWLMAADVKKMMLYQPGSNTMLWQSTAPGLSDKTRQNLLNLYQ